ncbi:MAG: nicotinate (nicotinamide) nucleotide adenylyltransferase [Verrucomicrobiota bacterium]
MKVGVYGGSFDPVHLAHEWIAHRACHEGLDRLILFPCFISPHKLDQSPQASSEDRLEMLEQVFKPFSEIQISSWELEKRSPSYTWQTLEHVRSLFPKADPVLIVGGDQFQVIQTWTRYSDWAHQVEFLVFPRRGGLNRFEAQEKEGLRFRVVSDFPPEVSSSDIRTRIRQGGDWKNLVSAPVSEWIIQKKLYGMN